MNPQQPADAPPAAPTTLEPAAATGPQPPGGFSQSPAEVQPPGAAPAPQTQAPVQQGQQEVPSLTPGHESHTGTPGPFPSGTAATP